MFCVNCFHPITRVVNSRSKKKHPQVWRRRKCVGCGQLFTSYERPSLAENKPVYLSSGEKTTFNLGRLILSMARAFSHNPDTAKDHALWLAMTIEDILSTECEIISPEAIAATTHQVLKRVDELAAIQYAAQQGLITSTRKRGRPSLSESA